MAKKEAETNRDLSQVSAKPSTRTVFPLADLGSGPLGEVHINDAALLSAFSRRIDDTWNDIDPVVIELSTISPRWVRLLDKYVQDHIGSCITLAIDCLLDEANDYMKAEIASILRSLDETDEHLESVFKQISHDEITKPLSRRMTRAMKKRIKAPGVGRPAGRKGQQSPSAIKRRQNEHNTQILQTMITLRSKIGKETDLTKKLVANEMKRDPKTLYTWLGRNRAARNRNFRRLLRQAEDKVRSIEDQE